MSTGTPEYVTNLRNFHRDAHPPKIESDALQLTASGDLSASGAPARGRAARARSRGSGPSGARPPGAGGGASGRGRSRGSATRSPAAAAARGGRPREDPRRRRDGRHDRSRREIPPACLPG